jgi:hypothetical protein
MNKNNPLAKALNWRNEHATHVAVLEGTTDACFAPSDEDMNHPALWKAASWRWLRTPMTHNLKILSDPLGKIIKGVKTFEIRKNDHGYKIGDTLILNEWMPATKETPESFTGLKIYCKVVYITNFEQKNNYVVMGITL